MDADEEEGFTHIMHLLSERLEGHNENRKAVQEELRLICNRERERIDCMEETINRELEEKFGKEDYRLQTALNELRVALRAEDCKECLDAAQRAKTELIVMQRYEIRQEENTGVSKTYTLSTEKKVVDKLLDLKQPKNLKINSVSTGAIRFEFVGSSYEERILSENGFSSFLTHKVLLRKKDEENWDEYHVKKLSAHEFLMEPDILEASTEYCMKVRTESISRSSGWSDTLEFVSPQFSECCAWKECPRHVIDDRKYSVDEKNPRVATKVGTSLCTVIGKSPIPLDSVTMWRIKILESVKDDSYGINVGIAPFDIDLNENYNYSKCGWYFDCYSSILWSGPPHNYDCGDKEYGPRKGDGEYVRTKDTVGVILDPQKGDLSFVVNSVDLGVAYSGIPLDKPLVPCVLLYYWGDSIELLI